MCRTDRRVTACYSAESEERYNEWRTAAALSFPACTLDSSIHAGFSGFPRRVGQRHRRYPWNRASTRVSTARVCYVLRTSAGSCPMSDDTEGTYHPATWAGAGTARRGIA